MSRPAAFIVALPDKSYTDHVNDAEMMFLFKSSSLACICTEVELATKNLLLVLGISYTESGGPTVTVIEEVPVNPFALA